MQNMYQTSGISGEVNDILKSTVVLLKYAVLLEHENKLVSQSQYCS